MKIKSEQIKAIFIFHDYQSQLDIYSLEVVTFIIRRLYFSPYYISLFQFLIIPQTV